MRDVSFMERARAFRLWKDVVVHWILAKNLRQQSHSFRAGLPEDSSGVLLGTTLMGCWNSSVTPKQLSVLPEDPAGRQ